MAKFLLFRFFEFNIFWEWAGSLYGKSGRKWAKVSRPWAGPLSKSYYKKKSVIMGFIASCSKMVCPRHLVLSDHVAISLLPLEIWLSFLSSSPFSKKTTNHDFFFCFVETTAQWLKCFLRNTCPWSAFSFRTWKIRIATVFHTEILLSKKIDNHGNPCAKRKELRSLVSLLTSTMRSRQNNM